MTTPSVWRGVSGHTWNAERADGTYAGFHTYQAAFNWSRGGPYIDTVPTCRHCNRPIVFEAPTGYWIDPEATGDDVMWRETCDEHDTRRAEHEPGVWRSTSDVRYWDAVRENGQVAYAFRTFQSAHDWSRGGAGIELTPSLPGRPDGPYQVGGMSDLAAEIDVHLQAAFDLCLKAGGDLTDALQVLEVQLNELYETAVGAEDGVSE